MALTVPGAWIYPYQARNGLARLARLPAQLRDFIIPPPDPLAERLAENGFSLGQPAYVRIFKQEARLEVWLQAASEYVLFRTYTKGLGF